jgi:hypothetical protein
MEHACGDDVVIGRIGLAYSASAVFSHAIHEFGSSFLVCGRYRAYTLLEYYWSLMSAMASAVVVTVLVVYDKELW